MDKFITLVQRKLKTGPAYYYRERCPVTGKMQNSAKRCPAHITTAKDAKAFAARRDCDLQKQALSQEAGVAMPTTAQKLWPLSGLLDWYAQRADASPRTTYGEACMAKRLKEKLGADLPVAGISTDLLETYQAEQKQAGYAARTVNMDLQLLKAALRKAVRNKKLNRLPCEIPRPLDGSGPRKRVLTPKEGQAMLTACMKQDRDLQPDKFRNPDSPARREYKRQLHDQVACYLHTGLRRDELFGLRWQDIDLQRREMTVETRKRGGGGEMHTDTVPLHPVAFEVLQRLHTQRNPAPGDLVFGTAPAARREMRNGKPRKAPGITGGAEVYRDHGFLKKLKALAKAAGIQDWHRVTIHGLRHSFCTEMADTAPLHVVRDLARHKSLKTTEGYVRTKRETMRQAVCCLNWNAPVESMPEKAQDPAQEQTPESGESYQIRITDAEPAAQVYELQRSVG